MFSNTTCVPSQAIFLNRERIVHLHNFNRRIHRVGTHDMHTIHPIS